MHSVGCTANNVHTEEDSAVIELIHRDPEGRTQLQEAPTIKHSISIGIFLLFDGIGKVDFVELQLRREFQCGKHASLMQCIGVSRESIILFYLRSIYIFSSAVSRGYVFAC